MPHLTTVTVGIPAYNEAGNIRRLVQDVLSQKVVNFRLSEVVVLSDGSTDNTPQIIRAHPNSRVKLIKSSQRRGLARTLNRLFVHTPTDIIVTLDGDIRLYDPNFLEKLLSPLLSGQADYVSSSISEEPSHSFFTQSLILSMQVKRQVYLAFSGGHNLYTSYGLARAYNRIMYSQLRFPVSIGNDMYSYLYSQMHNYSFAHVPGAIATYQLPENWGDYQRQSHRYFHARTLMLKHFSPSLVTEELRIPVRAYLRGLWLSLGLLLSRPHYALTYLLYVGASYLASRRRAIHDQWIPALSTKGGT